MKYVASGLHNILLMHDDLLVCAGLESALRRHPGLTVVASGVDDLPDDSPDIDVVVADYRAAIRLCESSSQALYRPLAASRVLVLTSNDKETDIRRAIEAGVHGYLLLGCSLDELVEGVTSVARGLRYLSHTVARRMADSLTRTALTSRELEVLQLVVNGESNKLIARQLRIEVGTVKSHMSAIMNKLGATSRTQAAGIAASRGLVSDGVPLRSHHATARMGLMENRAQAA